MKKNSNAEVTSGIKKVVPDTSKGPGKHTLEFISQLEGVEPLLLHDLTLTVDGEISTIENPRFIHHFFVALAQVRNFAHLEETTRAEAERAWLPLTNFLKDLHIQPPKSDDEESSMAEYKYDLHNFDRAIVRDNPLSQEELDRIESLKPLIEDKTASDEQIAELRSIYRKGEVGFNNKVHYVKSLVEEMLDLPGVFLAMRLAILEERNLAKLTLSKIGDQEHKLFPNSDKITSAEFGMPKFIGDYLAKGVRTITRQSAVEQFSGKKANTTVRYAIKDQKSDTGLVFDKKAVAMATAEQLADYLLKLKDPKILQTFFALWKQANIQDSAAFANVPISDVMRHVLQSSKDCNYNTEQRRDFTQALLFLDSITLDVKYRAEEINKKTGKAKPVLMRDRNVKLVRLVSTYAVKKQYQSLPKDQLLEEHFDQTVITKITGVLMPDNQELFAERSNIYFDSLLKLDANKDGKAILLGFTIQTRFNQLADKKQPIELDRGHLISICDYSQTNKTKPSKATQQIANNLDKLMKAGIISRHSGLTHNDVDKVKIFPPASKAIA